MAPSIFLSWSSDDKERVFPLRDRLRAVGLNVWEYSDDMPAGMDIHAGVVDAINQVQLAMICFSDATAAKEWIVREAEWCVQTLLAGDRPLRHVIPVWIGPHPANQAPAVITQRDLRIADVFGRGEQGVGQLVTDVFKLLGLAAPRIVPAALFAMSRQQCHELLTNGAAPELAAACLAAGMPPASLQQPAFLDRYGVTPEDLAPFSPGQRILDTIEQTLQLANRKRVLERKRPIFLRWVREQLVGPQRVQAVRNAWAAGDSLLIVDSVSTFDAAVRNALMELPQPRRPERAALLWIPPYTQHLAPLEQALEAAARVVPHFGDAFSEWYGTVDRTLAFDTATAAGLRLWLRRAFLAVEDEPEAVADNVSIMYAASAHRVNLAEMLPGPDS